MNADHAKEQSADVVDWEAARNLTGGDDGLLKDLVEMFPLEGARQLAAMKAAIEEKDGDALGRAAHTLKSSAKLFGAQVLANCAQEIESMSADLDGATQSLPELERHFERVVAALEQGVEQ